jgi:hypothetical protein
LYGLGVQGVQVCFFLMLYFHQVWLQHLSKIFDLWSSHYLPLHPSRYLGFSPKFTVFHVFKLLVSFPEVNTLTACFGTGRLLLPLSPGTFLSHSLAIFQCSQYFPRGSRFLQTSIGGLLTEGRRGAAETWIKASTLSISICLWKSEPLPSEVLWEIQAWPFCYAVPRQLKS